MIGSEFSFEHADAERPEILDPGVVADSAPSGEAPVDPGGDLGVVLEGSAPVGEAPPPSVPQDEAALDLDAFEALLPGAGFSYEFGPFFF